MIYSRVFQIFWRHRPLLRQVFPGASILLLLSIFCCLPSRAYAFDFFKDGSAIGAAFVTHLGMHEIGHQVVAEEAGAESPEMHFFTTRNGSFYPGLSTYKDIKKESELSYALAGESMAGYTFEYALQSYRHEESTYNKALMFFACTDFLWYTLLANYVHPDNDMYDPNLVREETSLGKTEILSLVLAKSLLNAYRVYNEEARFTPMIMVDETRAAFVVRYDF